MLGSGKMVAVGKDLPDLRPLGLGHNLWVVVASEDTHASVVEDTQDIVHIDLLADKHKVVDYGLVSLKGVVMGMPVGLEELGIHEDVLVVVAELAVAWEIAVVVAAVVVADVVVAVAVVAAAVVADQDMQQRLENGVAVERSCQVTNRKKSVWGQRTLLTGALHREEPGNWDRQRVLQHFEGQLQQHVYQKVKTEDRIPWNVH